MRLPRQDDMADAAILRGTFIGTRRKSPIGDRQVRGVAKEASGAGGVTAWERGRGEGREGAEGVDVDFYEAAGRVNS